VSTREVDWEKAPQGPGRQVAHREAGAVTQEETELTAVVPVSGSGRVGHPTEPLLVAVPKAVDAAPSAASGLSFGRALAAFALALAIASGAAAVCALLGVLLASILFGSAGPA
jgi:hypothetical protein